MADQTPKEHELEIVEAWILDQFGEERPDVLASMIKPDYLITVEKLVHYASFKNAIDAGNLTILYKVDGEWTPRVANEQDAIDTIGKMNRPYRVDDGTFSIPGIMMHTHNPTDGLPYNPEVPDAD